MTKFRSEITPLKKACSTQLLDWFSVNQRDLPWRYNRTPYRVWVSELMLQQTRVDTVIPYYRRWMKQFPSLKALAAADQEAVLKAWEGLGYYARARNLHKAARFIAEERNGRFPRTYEDVLTLPGIGVYTAAAITSLSYGEKVPVLDGNVFRVLSRLVCYGGDAAKPQSKTKMLALARELIPTQKPGEFNEAMMELGATVCMPRKTICETCPLSTVCQAYRSGTVATYPVKKPKAKVPHKVVGAGVVLNSKGEVLLARRPEDKMLGGLWEFPGGTLEKGEDIQACIRRELDEELGIHTRIGPFIHKVKHAYSHFTIELHAYAAVILKGRPRAIECSDFAWVKPEQIQAFPLSRADMYIRDVILHQKMKHLYRGMKSSG